MKKYSINIPSLHVDVDDFIPASPEEKEYMVQMRPSTTFFKDGVKRLLKNKVATVSFIIIVLITLASIILPMLWPYGYEQQLGQVWGRPVDPSYNNLAPFQYGETELAKIAAGESVFPHIFGTDAQGRDYFIRVVYGTRISLTVGFFASIIVLIIGMTIGSIAGYIGGKVDLVIMRIVDIFYCIPSMPIIIILGAVMDGMRVDPIYHVRKFHRGMDFSAPIGTEVFATGNAKVVFSGWKRGYGNTVILDHGFGYQTVYAHLYKSLVRKGQKVRRSDVIALVGNSGKSTGPHLHYEVRLHDKHVDPRNYYFLDLSPEEYDQMIQLSNNFGQMLD